MSFPLQCHALVEQRWNFAWEYSDHINVKNKRFWSKILTKSILLFSLLLNRHFSVSLFRFMVFFPFVVQCCPIKCKIVLKQKKAQVKYQWDVQTFIVMILGDFVFFHISFFSWQYTFPTLQCHYPHCAPRQCYNVPSGSLGLIAFIWLVATKLINMLPFFVTALKLNLRLQ